MNTDSRVSTLHSKDFGRSTAHLFPSFELLSKFCELPLQICNLFLQARDFTFQPRRTLSVHKVVRFWILCNWLYVRLFLYFHTSRKKVRITRFFHTGLAREQYYKRGLALHQVLQCRVHHAQILERVHAFRAASQFPRRLRPAQQQFAKNCRFRPGKIEHLRQPVLVPGNAAISSSRAGQRLFAQGA